MNTDFKEGYHYDRLIEQRILGQLLIEEDAYSRVYGILKPEWFYDDGHQIVFRCLQEMKSDRLAIKQPLVRSMLISKKIETINNINVGAYLIGLENNVVNTIHLEQYCAFLYELYRRRRSVEIMNKNRDLYDSREAIAEIKGELSDLDSGFDKNGKRKKMQDILFELWEHRAEVVDGKVPVITTGFKKIDSMNRGFMPGNLVVIGARPSVGKSALMAKMVLDISKTGKSVGVVSLEMSAVEIAARLYAVEKNVSYNSIFLDTDDDKKMFQEFGTMANVKIELMDSNRVDVDGIEQFVRAMKRDSGCDIVFIDYLQLMDTVSGNKNYNREQEVAKTSRGLKMLAKELNIPIVVLCQLNRESVSRAFAQRYPRLSDLRESGAIEQDADIVLFLHRDFVVGHEVNENGDSTEFEADLICAKWRNGKTGSVKIKFDPPKMRFYEYEYTQPWRPPTETNQDDNPF